MLTGHQRFSNLSYGAEYSIEVIGSCGLTVLKNNYQKKHLLKRFKLTFQNIRR